MAKLHFYYSAMHAGKSTTLLQSSHNYQERGMETILFAPAIDDRYGAGKISTRIGLEADAIAIEEDYNIYRHVELSMRENPKLKCVLIDEAQFLSKAQVAQLCRICDTLNIPVLAYGIRTDFQAEPFAGSLYLLAWADTLVEIKTICHCGKKAIMNMRIDDSGRMIREGEQIEIGGNERYVATCRQHFWLGQGVRDELRAPLAEESLVT